MRAKRAPPPPETAQPRRPGDHPQAAQILQHMLTGDVLGQGPGGHVYLLLEVEGWLFDRLCRWDAENEDIEEDDAAEEDDPVEASTGVDESELEVCHSEPSANDPRWVVSPLLRDPTGRRGRWLMVRR